MCDCTDLISTGLRRAMGLVGERWALLVLAALIDEPQRFSYLKRQLPGISANILAKRLQELEQRGLIERIVLPQPASAQVYTVTSWGRQVGPALEALSRWAIQSYPDPT